MRGLRRRILAIVEEVNHEIRVDLGIEEPLPGLKTIDTLDVTNDLPEFNQADNEDESEEATAFGKILDDICLRYENVETEPDEFDDTEIWEEPIFETTAEN